MSLAQLRPKHVAHLRAKQKLIGQNQVAQLRPKRLAQLEAKWVAQLRPFYLIRRLKIDYDDDVSHVLDEYSKLSPEGKLIVLNDLKSRYQVIAQGIKREYEFAMNYAKETYKEAFGLSDKTVERMFQPNSSKKFKIYGRLTSISFLISCLSFITVVIILCFKY